MHYHLSGRFFFYFCYILLALPDSKIDTTKKVYIYSYFEKGWRINVHATIPKGNMGYDQYTVSDDCSCQTYFCCFPLALANTLPRPLGPILSNFFKNSELKTTHNAFRDCRVHFFREPFSKLLYSQEYRPGHRNS